MATRERRLAEFDGAGEPPPGMAVQVLCEDQSGTYQLPFACHEVGRVQLRQAADAAQELAKSAVAAFVAPKAKTVAVQLGREGDDARLTIVDDGVGFAAGPRSSGNGVRNMRGRAFDTMRPLHERSTLWRWICSGASLAKATCRKFKARPRRATRRNA